MRGLEGYVTVETNDRVPVAPDIVTRFRWRAEKRCADRNAARLSPTYRYEVVRENGRWAVVAMQNVAQKI